MPVSVEPLLSSVAEEKALNEKPVTPSGGSVESNDFGTRYQEESESEDEPQPIFNQPIDPTLLNLLTPPSILAGSTEVSVTSYSLGVFLGVAFTLATSLILQQVGTAFPHSFASTLVDNIHQAVTPSNIPWQIPTYCISLSIFHFLEYWTTAKYNPKKVTPSSFLLRNGRLYLLAHLLAFSEALLERYLLTFLSPTVRLTLSQNTRTVYISLLGLVVIVGGQGLRSAAMIHCASNFSHSVVRRRDYEHELVTTGVYSFSRHPSYSGFFFWALGTQILLVNPISFIIFWCILWKFFRDRIEDEERLLVGFFGQQYLDYRKTTPTRIPLIN